MSLVYMVAPKSGACMLFVDICPTVSAKTIVLDHCREVSNIEHFF